MDSKHIPAIQKRILLLAGTPVILDSDLARLYGVETKALNREVLKRLAEIDKSLLLHDTALRDLCQKILPLLQTPPDPPKREIGFRHGEGRGPDDRAGRKPRKKSD